MYQGDVCLLPQVDRGRLDQEPLHHACARQGARRRDERGPGGAAARGPGHRPGGCREGAGGNPEGGAKSRIKGPKLDETTVRCLSCSPSSSTSWDASRSGGGVWCWTASAPIVARIILRTIASATTARVNCRFQHRHLITTPFYLIRCLPCQQNLPLPCPMDTRRFLTTAHRLHLKGRGNALLL